MAKAGAKTSGAGQASHGAARGAHAMHVVPVWGYATIFLALLALTFTTVYAAFIDLGPLNNVVALSIGFGLIPLVAPRWTQQMAHGLHPLLESGILLTAVAAVALTAGLAVATFVKAFGVGFLAKPRSESAAAAHESPFGMLAGMGVAAVACVVLALWPAAILPAVRAAVGATAVSGDVTLRLNEVTGALSPFLLTLGLVVVSVVVVGVVLIAEGFDHHVPKGYIYFAMAFSVVVEMLNIRMRKRSAKATPVQVPLQYSDLRDRDD